MTFLKAIVLGVVQGLTEFLPISSSGHLALAQNLLNIAETPLFFDIMLHVGTLGAVVVFFWRDIQGIFAGIFGREPKTGHYKKKSARMFALFIVIGSVPTAIIALALESYVKKAFSNPLPVSIMLIITGVILWLSGRFSSAGKSSLSIVRALVVGTAQGIAVLPGISRSGATISTALMCGIEREESARFSLLMSVPAILGATAIELKDVASIDVPLVMIIAGTLVAFVTGYLAIRFLLGTLKRGHFSRFAYYCWFIGVIAILGYVISR